MDLTPQETTFVCESVNFLGNVETEVTPDNLRFVDRAEIRTCLELACSAANFDGQQLAERILNKLEEN